MQEPFAEYDEEADALYVTLLPDAEVHDTVELDDMRMVDYTRDRRVAGIEFISPSAGIDLSELPFAEEVEKAIGNSGYEFKVLA